MNKRIKAMLTAFSAEEIKTGLLTSQQNTQLQTFNSDELERTVKAELLVRSAGAL